MAEIGLAGLDSNALVEFITAQRWYGSKTREIAHVRIVDEAPLRTGESPLCSIAVATLMAGCRSVPRYGESCLSAARRPAPLRPAPAPPSIRYCWPSSRASSGRRRPRCTPTLDRATFVTRRPMSLPPLGISVIVMQPFTGQTSEHRLQPTHSFSITSGYL